MNQNFMKEKPILPLVLSMALPMTISMLVNALYNIVDSYFVARISENAMTALSLVYPVQNIVTAVTVGFGIGINALIAFYLGAGNHKLADKSTSLGMICNVIHGVLLTVVCIGIMPKYLRLFTHDVDTINLGLNIHISFLLFQFQLPFPLVSKKYFRLLDA